MPGMTELPRRYDVTITVDRDGGSSPNPANFAVAAEQAASARAASIVSAHTARQIISIVTVTVPAADRPAAVAVALAVVSDALKRRLRHLSADGTAVPDLMWRLIEPGVPVVLGAARPAPQRQVAHPPAPALGLASWLADARHPRNFLRHTGSKRMPHTDTGQACGRTEVQASDDHPLSSQLRQRHVRSGRGRPSL